MLIIVNKGMDLRFHIACPIMICVKDAAIFFPGLFFIIFSHSCPFMKFWGWGFRVRVLDWVLGVGVFS